MTFTNLLTSAADDRTIIALSVRQLRAALKISL